MCGIAGIVNWRGPGPDRDLIARMIDRIAYRGPDAKGFYREGDAALGHARLSIIDLDHGSQPMSNEDGTLWITFNGEIFNYLELRAELLDRGHRFRSSSDTEVILHLFEDLGDRCVERLNGQWAFAVWDTRRKRLFASRDRLGIRPLFYAQSADSFAFASEIKALLLHPRVSKELDLAALDQVFTFWTTLPPRTPFRDVRELPPAHSLVAEAGRIEVSRYWQLGPRPEPLRSEEQYAERLMELLAEATRLQLRSDVPVGAYLSGGLDSTVTTAIAKRECASSIRTFSVTFEDAQFDESAFQQISSRWLNTDHEAIHCTYGDICAAFPEVVWHAERPLLRTAPVPLFHLSRLVRDRGVKVVITGEGADEMMGGYDLYKEAKIRRFLMVNPQSAFRPLMLKRLYPWLPALQHQSAEYLKVFFRIDGDVQTEPFFSHLPRWGVTSMIKVFFSDAVRSATQGQDPKEALLAQLPVGYADWDFFTKAQYLESTLLLPGYILSSQGDRVAMAHAVEGRYPFLDHRIAEFALALPARLKMKVLQEKYLLKRVARELVPPEVLRRPKQPYRAPDARSFFDPQTGAARSAYVEDSLSTPTILRHGLFDPRSVAHLVRKVKSGRSFGVKDDMALVGILSTHLLLEQITSDEKRT